MAECSIADDYAIFKKDHRPVRFANLEGKVVCPPPVQCVRRKLLSYKRTGYSIITGIAILMPCSCRNPKPPLLELQKKAAGE